MSSECISGSGIVFVRFDDPLSCIRIGVTKQEFSTVGFYYEDSSSGRLKHSIVLIDTMRIEKPRWLGEGSTIQTLSYDPLVSGLAVKRLRPVIGKDGVIDSKATDERNSCFRQSIAHSLKYSNKKPTREIIAQIFGIKIDKPSEGVSSVELINRVIDKMGESEKVPSKGGPSKKGNVILYEPDEYGTNGSSRLDLMKRISACISQNEPKNPSSANKLIQSYIHDNDLFDDLVYIDLPEKSKIDVELAKERSLCMHRELLEEMSTEFTNMLFEDQEFFEVISAGINRDKSEDFDRSRAKKELSIQCGDLSSRLIDLFNKARVDGILDEKQFKKDVHEHNDLNAKLQSIYGCTLSDGKKTVRRTCNRTAITKGCVTHTEFTSSISNIHDHVGYIIEQIRKKETPVIDINALSSWVNKLALAAGLECDKLKKIKGEWSINSVIKVSSDKGAEIRLMLRSERKIRISTKDPDLSCFSKCELREIIEVLNEVANGDHTLDKIRRAILEKLS